MPRYTFADRVVFSAADDAAALQVEDAVRDATFKIAGVVRLDQPGASSQPDGGPIPWEEPPPQALPTAGAAAPPNALFLNQRVLADAADLSAAQAIQTKVEAEWRKVRDVTDVRPVSACVLLSADRQPSTFSNPFPIKKP